MATPADHPVLVQAARNKAALARREAQAVQRLTDAYLRTYKRIEPSIEALVQTYIARLAANEDEVLTLGQITRLRQFQRLKAQTKAELEKYGVIVVDEIAAGTDIAFTQARTDALNMVQAHFTSREGKAAIQSVWNRLPVEAVEQIVGFQDVIAQRYDRFYAEGTQDLVDSLADAMIRGQNPRLTAAQVAKNMKIKATNIWGNPLTDALRQARTSQIYAYREATRANYLANSDIVGGWIWQASLDDRTCMSCLANHGEEFPLTETLNDHHNGRCAMIPKVTSNILGISPVELPDAEEWFNERPDLPKSEREAAQIKQMGAGKYELYKAGKVKFKKLTDTYPNEIYGEMRREPTLKELTK